MNKLNPIGKLAIKYKASPMLSGLLKLVIPFWVFPDSLLQARVDEIRTERLETFFDELMLGKASFTQSNIKSEDFLHHYFLTVRAVVWTRQRQKIRYFARLLKSSVDNFAPINEYEEYLKILDDLSYTEINILKVLENYMDTMVDKVDIRRKELIKALTSLGCSEEDLAGKLTRLSRSGCFALKTGFVIYGDAVLEGNLTTTYFNLKTWAFEQSRQFE
jgi:hypothetical protein